MKGIWYGVMAHVVAHVMAALPMSAQRVIAASTGGDSGHMITNTQGITLSMQAIPVESAVVAIARQSKLRLQYRDDVFTGVGKTVSLSLENVPVEEAFSRVFLGTSLRAVVIGRNFVNIERDPNAVAPIEQGIIVGKVRDPQGKPLSGVSVRLEADAPAVVTGTDGTFRIDASVGTHQLSLRLLGFVRQRKDVTVEAGKTVTVDVVMEPSANVLGEVVVTGTVVATERKAIATPITVIRAEEIERRGITRIDQLFRGEIPGLLAMEQGMNAYDLRGRELRDGVIRSAPNTAGSSTAKMYSRGSSSLDGNPNPIKTYVDGVELLDASYLGTIDPRSIERIEIVTGPQAATIYGSGALGGVMQIFTKKGTGSSKPDITATLRYGVLESNVSSAGAPSHNHAIMVNGGSGPALSYSVNLSYLYTGQWAPSLFSRSYGASLGATHTAGPLTVNGSLSFTNGSNGTLDIQNNVGGSPYVKALVAAGEWNCGLQNGSIDNCARSLNTSQLVSRRISQTASFNADYRMGQLVQHHITLGRVQNNFELDPLSPTLAAPNDTMVSFSKSDGQRTTWGYNTTFSPSPVRWFSTVLTVGANGGWGANTRTAGTAPEKNATSWTTSTVTQIFDDKTWGAFGSWRVGFAEKIYLTLGLRAERNRAYGEEHKLDWTPTNGITYTFETGDLSVKLLGSYGRATRAPAAAQRLEVSTSPSAFYDPASYISQVANPALAPEYESGPQGGIEVYYGNRGSLTINRYTQRVTNLLSRVKMDSVPRVYIALNQVYYGFQYQWQNLAKVKKQGWESTGSLTLGPVTLRGTYSWNDSRIADLGPGYTGSYYPGQSFDFIPTHLGNFAIEYAHRGTSVRWGANYVGTRPVTSGALPVELAWGSYHRLQQYKVRDNSMAGTYRKDGYTKSDLSAQHRLNPWATLTLHVTNLGNSFADDNENSLAPALGRQTMFGMSLRY